MKSPATTVPLGPWVRGIQNVNDPARMPKGTLLEADNVLIASDGSVTPRNGYAPVTTGVSSLFRHNGRTYGLYEKKAVELFDDGLKVLSTFDIEGRVTWGVLNDEPVFTNPTVLARISDGVAKRIGVEAPVVRASGQLAATHRAVAVSFVNEDGEEGPLSPIFTGTEPPAPPVEDTVKRMRVYRPLITVRETPDEPVFTPGDILYFEREVALGVVPGAGDEQAKVGAAIGMPADNMNKARMPGGNYVRYWRGRLLVARGRMLYFSDPLRYGMYDRSAGFVTFEARIDFIEPVEGGVFVALRNMGVHFLAGDAPERWERKVADIIPAQPGASLVIPTAQMKLDVQSKPEWVAVWFTHKGFALGLPSGSILYPQADLLSGLPLGTGSLHFEGDRLIALSQ